MFKSAEADNKMQTISINPGAGIGDRELIALLGHATNPKELLDEEKQAIPGSVEFHYRNHPNLLRVTRLRANRHGNRMDSSLDRQLGVN